MTKQSTKDFFKEYGANKMNPTMIHSMAFGRAFWLDENDEFCSAPWRQDGTVDMEQQDYVSEWNDLEGVNIGLLLDIYKVEILNKINHGGSILHKDFAHEITNKRLEDIKGSLL